MDCKKVLFILGFFLTGYATDTSSVQLHDWEVYKQHFDKVYSAEEEMMRKTIFLENVVDVLVHNNEANIGLHSHTLSVNHFSDLTREEWNKLINRLLGLMRAKQEKETPYYYQPEKKDTDLPREVDWRKQNAVTPVRNQGNCGACWTFSATGAIEGAWAIKTGQLSQLSVQNLMDCTDKEGNDGCEGGNMDAAFDYVINNGGIDKEICYPYKQKQQFVCRFKKYCTGANITNYAQITEGDEQALKAAVALHGPVAAAINAESKDMQHYSGGIYNNTSCSIDVTHGILVVGYGTNEIGQDYWIIKNSWGNHWGTEGYMKLARNQNNQCGITNMASFPIV